MQNKYNHHKIILTDLAQMAKDLPEELSDIICKIQTIGDLILQAIEDYPEEAITGIQFLNRYLPITQSIIVQLLKLYQQGNTSLPQFTKLKEQALQKLPDLYKAFTHTHENLLKNDFETMTANLKMLDQLLKSEGLIK